MKTKSWRVWLVAGLAAAAMVGGWRLRADDHPKLKEADIYDESLDGAKQVDAAVTVAGKEHKRVLLQFGANWCIWCHRLHNLMDSDKGISETLKADYVVVLVDVNKGHNGELAKKYETEKLGIPCLVVLDSDGKHLKTKNSGELEEGDHHSPEKVMAFLKEWAPKR
jgi:thiol:disulfide interchange protein